MMPIMTRVIKIPASNNRSMSIADDTNSAEPGSRRRPQPLRYALRGLSEEERGARGATEADDVIVNQLSMNAAYLLATFG